MQKFYTTNRFFSLLKLLIIKKFIKNSQKKQVIIIQSEHFQKESGFFFEKQIAGGIIDYVGKTEEECTKLLDCKNWDKFYDFILKNSLKSCNYSVRI